MAVDLNNKRPIDENDPAVEAWLSNLQGNILRGHGRDFGVYIFFSFGDDIGKARKMLREFASDHVTSARKQYQETTAYRKSRLPGLPFGNLFLSANGYRRLGFDPGAAFPEPGEESPGRRDPVSTFASGMRATAEADFGDPPVDQWDAGYRGAIDGLILLAGDDESELLDEAHTIAGRVRADHTIRAIEVGRALRNPRDQGVDHFGFLDGLSQPQYLADDFLFDAAGRPCRTRRGQAIDQWDPFEPLARVLIPDPFVAADDCFGSFLVFRKLEQDVRGFRTRELELAQELCLPDNARERAAAMVVGRFRDGTPLSLSLAEGGHPEGDNNFTFAADLHGHQCPRHAHIRKVNQRGGAGGPDLGRQRRITRRSITYGSLKPQPAVAQSMDSLPTGGVGLLFMCFQAGIRRQFAFIQNQWANDVDFPAARTGSDPLVGQSPVAIVAPQEWPSLHGAQQDRLSSFGGYVTMKGGEFFFAPSMRFFATL